MSLFNELKRRNVFRVAIAYTVVAWLVAQVIDLVLETFGAPPWFIKSILVLLAGGLPIAIVFAWAFEMTPEGIKKEKDVDRSQSVTSQTGRKLDRMIIGIMAVVIAFLVLDRFVLTDNPQQAQLQTTATEDKQEPAEEAHPSVAVLPFVNMSDDASNEYFSDGLTETLLHMLAQLPELRVAARTSSFAFKGQNTSIADIASTLGVAHILEGSVQKAGNRVRITAQLIRADDGFHVWSQNYDRTLEDIFAIQDEIARDVAGALDLSLLGGANSQMRGVETSSLTAYENYLKGLEQQAIFSYGSLAIAESHFKQALFNDPGFTDASLALARNYLLQYYTGVIKDEEVLSLIEPLIQQVREQHPENRLARALELMAILDTNRFQISRAEAEPIINELRNLLPLIPTETYVRTGVARILNGLFDQGQQALEVLEAGLMIDPLDANLHVVKGYVYTTLKRRDEARKAYLRALELAPDNPMVYTAMARLETENDNLIASLGWEHRLASVDQQDHEISASIANILYKLELPEEGDKWHARLKILAPNSPVTKEVEIHRLLARNEPQEALNLSRSMISDQVDNRQSAFFEAVFIYQRLMMESGKSREAYDFLVSVRPEISDYATLPGDLKGVFMQWSSIALMSGFESADVRNDAWLKTTQNWDEFGYPWRKPERKEFIWDMVFSGDLDGAINATLETRLTRPMARYLEIHSPNDRLVIPEVYADPRVVARLAELSKEYEQLREQVRDLMLEPEWHQ
jgi:TolB-like protein